MTTQNQADRPRAAVPATAAPRTARATAPAETTSGGAGGARFQELMEYLAQVPMFADLDLQSLREVASLMHRRTFQAGEVIFHRGDPGQIMYLIRRGKVKISLTSVDGQEVALALLGRGEYFGELALLDGQPRSADTIAIEEVEAFWLQRADFIRTVTHHPHIAIEVMNVLARRLRLTDEMVQDLLFLDVHGRVAKKLIELTETHGVRTAEGIRIEMRLTQGELATMVGASRESVNKVMGYLTERQYVTTDKHRTTVTRLAELRRRVC
ncbi:MAG TPA: Crp/Fnr family transcriptional regulator [Ktedonobacterales bacterium]|nr:Crp/Fnr family transcriptional regulator [Ktedonobacterales bacterium]